MKKSFFILIVVVFLMPLFVFGQSCGNAGQPPCSALGVVDTSINPLVGTGSIDPATGFSTTITTRVFVTTILSLINWFSWFIAVAAVTMGLYSGWLFITARDNAQQIIAAQKTMLYAVIGIGVAIIAFGIIAITKSLLSIV